MTPPTVVALGCTLLSEHTELNFEDAGFLEHTRLRVAGADACLGLELQLPDGVELTSVEGHVRPADDPSYRIDRERLERVASRPDGTTTWRLHLPELAAGDVAAIELVRTWTEPVDLVWRPGLDRPLFAEMRLPKGITVLQREGLSLEERMVWAQRPVETAVLTLAHPWAQRTPPVVPSTAVHALTADEALARVAELRLVPATWFGSAPRVGDDALRLGAADRRGVARTLVALARVGPDQVELGRFTADPDAEPVPGADEAAVLWTDEGPVVLLHPSDTSFPLAGALRTPSGLVPLPTTPRRHGVNPGPVHTADLPIVETHVAIDVDGKDPLDDLHPGGDLVVRAEQRLAWPDGLAAPWVAFFPLPPGTLDVLQPMHADCDQLRETADGVWVIAGPGTRSCTFSIVLPLDDAWGPIPRAHVPGAEVRTTGHATWTPPDGPAVQGELVLEDDTWRLAGLAGRRLLASQEELDHELWDRFVDAAMPEPGLSASARARREGWTLAGCLKEILASRVVVHPLAHPPDRPRPLVRARRSRVLTAGEAAMTGALLLQQAHLDATWVLARPRTLGPREALAPVGFDEGLVRVEHQGRAAWIDVGCEACGPFEIRPELVGAEAIGPGPDVVGVVAAPGGLPQGVVLRDGLWSTEGALAPSGVGVVRLEVGAPTEAGLVPTTWRLEGADALALRRELADVPPGQRLAALRHLLGAPAGAEVSVEGLAEPGAPVTLSTLAEPDRVPDVLARPLTGRPPPGAAWIGLRERRSPAPAEGIGPAVDDVPEAPGARRVAAVDGTLVEQQLVRRP